MDDFTGTRLEIHGSDGWVAVEGDVLRHFQTRNGFALPSVEMPQVPAEASEIEFGYGHVYEVLDFIRTVRAGEEPPVPAADGRHLMAVIESAYRSAEEGGMVEVVDGGNAYSSPPPHVSLLSAQAHQ
jgi:predicted dehydrogenase